MMMKPKWSRRVSAKDVLLGSSPSIISSAKQRPYTTAGAFAFWYMTRPYRRYTPDEVKDAVRRHTSWNAVTRELKEGKVSSGSSQSHLKKLAIRWGLDFSHFTGQGWSKGVPPKNKASIESVLCDHTGQRLSPPPGGQLRRVLIEVGVAHGCAVCALTNAWNNKPLVLQVDHINGNRFDCRIENLRFLCPNCHSQTGNWGVLNAVKYETGGWSCPDCGRPRSRKGKRCRSCAVALRRR